MAEQNAEIRRWAEENGLTVGAIFGEQRDTVERVAPRVPVVEVTVRIDEDVYEAAMRPRSSKRRCESGRGGTRLPKIT